MAIYIIYIIIDKSAVIYHNIFDHELLLADGIDPIEFGSSAAYRKRMNDLKDATNDFNKAMGTKPAIEDDLTPRGSQAGKQSKVCVPPPQIARCQLELGRGVRLARSPKCMTNNDMAWFRNQCAQF